MRVDLALVGGGLANSLIALALARNESPLSYLLIERGDAIGGQHTWSFHGTDVSPVERELLEGLIGYSWTAQDVRFPRRSRTLPSSYHSILSARLHEVVTNTCGSSVLVNANVVELGPTGVRLADGRDIEARAVVDGRGFSGSSSIELGFQKFLGRVLELESPHALERPLLMDATVEQVDGFRFFYVLPLSETRVLVEDTRYSDNGDLPREHMRSEVQCYVETAMGTVTEVTSEEEGVLPIVLGGDIDAFWGDGDGIARSGLRAGLFHPTTGYSLGEAARFAVSLSTTSVVPETLYRVSRDRSIDLWRKSGFFRMLNRMLFRAARPDERYRVLERFYGLPVPLIERFYAGRPSVLDKMRILTGRPPVPLLRALRCMSDSSASSAVVERKP